MSRYKVVHLTSVHQPFDTRIFYKQCRTLVRHGYDVVLIAPFDHDDIIDNVRIRSVARTHSRFRRMTRIIWMVYQAALDEDADIYHFHDPELITVGILLKAHGKKVIYDIHENLPAQILGKAYLRPAWLRRLAASGAQFVDQLASIIFDGVAVANPLVAERFTASHAILLANYPLLKLIDETLPADIPLSSDKILIYVGGLTPIRGVCELVQAMDLLEEDVELWLVGPWFSDQFKRICQNTPGWERVRYLGYVKPEEVYAYLKCANVGMVTLHPQENYLSNLPVKAFEYMACSLPMVMSDFPYWREVFEGAAVFVDPRDPKAIAAAVTRLLSHDDEANDMGKAGRHMVETLYSWERESEKLLDLYRRILEERADGSVI